MRFYGVVAVLAALSAANLTPASAAVINSVSRATFASAVAGGTITGQNFDSLANGAILGSLGGVTYSASGGSPIVTNGFLTSTSPNGLGSTSNGFFGAQESATFTFTVPVTAFAIDVNTFANSVGAYSATLNIGDVVLSNFEVFSGTVTGQFIGFVSDVAFTSVVIASLTGFTFTLDTLVFGDAKAVKPPDEVPLPGGLVFLLTGLAAAGAARRRA